MNFRPLNTWENDEGDVQLISTVLVLIMTLMIITGIMWWALPEVQRRSLDVQYRSGITQFETLDMNIKKLIGESVGIGNVNGSCRTSHLSIPSGSLSVERGKEIWVITSTRQEIGEGDIRVEYNSSQNSITIINYTRDGTTTKAPMNITYSWFNHSNDYSNIQSPYYSETGDWLSSQSDWSVLEPAKRITYPIVTRSIGNGSGASPYMVGTNKIEYTVKTTWNNNVGKKRWEISFTQSTKLTDIYIQLHTVSGIYNPASYGWKKIDNSVSVDVLIGEIWILSTDFIKYEIPSSIGNFYIKAENSAIVTNYPSSTPYVKELPIFFNAADEVVLYFVKMNSKGIFSGGRGDYEITTGIETIGRYTAPNPKFLRIQVVGDDGGAWHRYLIAECGFTIDGVQVRYSDALQNVKLIYYVLSVDMHK